MPAIGKDPNEIDALVCRVVQDNESIIAEREPIGQAARQNKALLSKYARLTRGDDRRIVSESGDEPQQHAWDKCMEIKISFMIP